MRHDARTLRYLSIAAIGLLALSFAPSTSATPAHVATQPAASSGAWTNYHRDDAHTGFDNTLPNAMGATNGWVSGVMDQEVFASPLVYNGVVYAATLGNTVYAFRQSDGVELWRKNVGAPQTLGWTCGNINPTGILGTPVIDVATNRLYAAAEITGATPTYHLFGLDLANLGNIVLDTPIAPAGFDWAVQQERGALAIRNGNVYVPFGGRIGDCGNYHGWVVAVPTDGTAITSVYQTPGIGAGFWAAGGVAVDDATNKIFVTSGNSMSGCAANPDGTPVYEGDAVLRLSATLVREESFLPVDWQSPYCALDEDLGGAGPMLISSSLLFQAGKAGGGFLLNPNALGGMGGQLFPTPRPQTYSQADVCYGNRSNATFGSFAYAAPYIYLQCDGGRGLVGLNTNPGAPAFSPCDSTCGGGNWKAGYGMTFGPPIVAGGIVWAATNGGGLYGYNAVTGVQMFHSGNFAINRFVSPSEAGGQVFVPSRTVIRSFNMTFGPWNSLNGIFLSGPDASSWAANRVDVFGVGQDSGLWQNTWNGTLWAGWSPLGGIVTADPGAVSWSAGRIDVFVRGQDGALYHRYSDGTRWYGGWEGLGGGMKFGPDVASWAPGRLDIFITGLDNQLWHRYWGGGGWGGWEPLGGNLTSSPTAVSWGPNRLDIFARGSDNQMWHFGWAGNRWFGWEPLGGQFSGGPDAASCSPGHMDVFARGMDNSLFRLGWNGAQWSGWQQVGTAPWTSDPSAVCSPGTSTINLFARGADNAIWQTTVTGS
ncbi:MAG: hypothetical protein PVSMB3_04020 [Candidatus Dormibacteraceae bacterium]